MRLRLIWEVLVFMSNIHTLTLNDIVLTNVNSETYIDYYGYTSHLSLVG